MGNVRRDRLTMILAFIGVFALAVTVGVAMAALILWSIG
jgi:hypothetical protein